MNPNAYRLRLPAADRERWDAAIARNNATGAAQLLVQAGCIDEAIQFCVESSAFSEALEIAIRNQKYDFAVALCRKMNSPLKLAEVLQLKGDFEQAADLLAELQQYEAAAKIYFKIKQFDRAAVLYAKNHQFMNAVMCYQKSGNLAKQLEMQVSAFEYDLALANGDVNAVTVSRSMAIYAASAYLDDEETRLRGLQILKKADALLDTADELKAKQKYEQAAYCYEYAQDLHDALNAYIRAGNADRALDLCGRLHDDNLEIQTLLHFHEYFRVGQKYAQLKHWDEALEALRQIDTSSKDYASAVELQGDIFCKQKNFTDAVLCYESLYWLNLPQDAVCRIAFKAGYSCEAVEDFQNAIKNYQRVFDIDPDFHDVGNIIMSLNGKLKQKSAMQLSNNNTYRQASVFQNSMVKNSQILRTPSKSRARNNSVIIGETEVPIIDFDRYHVLEEVAHGGMGVVYKAQDTILMRTVALKVLSQKLKDNQVALEYFMREARASAQLTHINIVTVYDVGSLNDGTVYMAMEYIDGKTLKQLVQQTGPFPTKFLVQVSVHACRGLQYAHDNGIIHRDVKSSNMMLAKRDKTLKILDLGLAKVVTEQDRSSTQAIGTPYYMSPEQILGNEIDCRSDIYSLGVTMYELATGTLPFVKGDLSYKHLHEEPPPPSQFYPKINPMVEQIILKMMQKKPENRFSSCNEVLAALKRVDYHSESGG